MHDVIRIIIVDDHKVVLNSWKSLLENNPRLRVVGIYLDGPSAIEKAREVDADIALVDVKMRPLNGFETAEALLFQRPELRIIGMSVNNQVNYANKMMEIGAAGYLTKTSTLEEIYHCIAEVHAGRRYMCDEIRKKLNDN